MAGSATERFRPASLDTSASRGMQGAGNYGGYYQDSASGFPGAGLAQSAMSYQQADYSQDARHSHNFGAYNPNMMYPVGQTGPQNPYDAAQQFQGRQPAPMPMMAGNVPQYFQSDASAAAAAVAATASTIPAGQAAGAATPSSAIYPQQPQIPGFSASLPSLGGGAGASQPGDKTMAVDDPEYSASGTGMEERWADYQNRLAGVFQNIQSADLRRARESLLGVSNWLLTQVVDLGLHVDDCNLHEHRLKMWHDFNHAWLGLLQKQKDITESEERLQAGQSLISKDELEDMGKELVRLCDGVEKHGLVDYEYGVWEEQIIAILTDCLDLYESDEQPEQSGR